MRLPWLQVDQDAFERGVELAAILGIDEAQAMGHIVHLWRWALSRPADPELTGTVAGPTSVVQIEAGARWRGERGALVDALVDVGLIEDAGAEQRVRGLERYRRELQKRDADRERKAEDREKRGARAPSNGLPTDVQRTAPGNSGQTQTQTQTQIPSPSETVGPPPPRRRVDENSEGFWAWAQDQRHLRGWVRERPPHPRQLSTWLSRAMGEVGGDVARLRAGWLAFAADPHWAPKQAPWAGWLAQWERFVPAGRPVDVPSRPDAAALTEVLGLIGDSYLGTQFAQLRWRRAAAGLVGTTDDPFFGNFTRDIVAKLGLPLIVESPPLPTSDGSPSDVQRTGAAA